MELTVEQIQKLDYIEERIRFVTEMEEQLNREINDATVIKKEADNRQEVIDTALVYFSRKVAEVVQPCLQESRIE